MYLGTVLGSIGNVGSWIEILGLIGNENDVLFEFRLSRIFRISSVDYSLSCYLIFLYIWSILWNITHASLGSLCLDLLLLMIDTFTNNVLIFFPCVSRPSYLLSNRLITEWVYLHDELSVISLVDFCALHDFMISCSSSANVLKPMGIPWEPSISEYATTNDYSYESR